jgi:hypothetical protein
MKLFKWISKKADNQVILVFANDVDEAVQLLISKDKTLSTEELVPEVLMDTENYHIIFGSNTFA